MREVPETGDDSIFSRRGELRADDKEDDGNGHSYVLTTRRTTGTDTMSYIQ